MAMMMMMQPWTLPPFYHHPLHHSTMMPPLNPGSCHPPPLTTSHHHHHHNESPFGTTVPPPIPTTVPQLTPHISTTTTTTGVGTAPQLPTKKPSTAVLSHRPLTAPSPYATTHDLVLNDIHLTKSHAPGSSFGVVLRLHMTSVLVDPPAAVVTMTTHHPTGIAKESADNNNNAPTASVAASNDVPSNDSGPPPSSSTPVAYQPPRRTRRRRVCYTVLTVDRIPENSLSAAAAATVLQTNDIILSIDGTAVDGLTFAQACGLFRQCTTTTPDGAFIQCRLRVAHQRTPVPPRKIPHPIVLVPRSVSTPSSHTLSTPHPTTLQKKRSPYDRRELYHLSEGLLQRWADSEPGRLLGTPISSIAATIESIVLAEPRTYAVNHPPTNDIAYMVDLWYRQGVKLEKTMRQNARTYWTTQWFNESDPHPQGPVAALSTSNAKYLTDAQRHTMRRRPVPDTARTRCRCMSTDHFYVNDEKCPLYRNLRKLSDPKSGDHVDSKGNVTSSMMKQPSTDKEIARRSREMAQQASRDLNTMEKACCDRLARTLTEQDNVRAEQQFVAQMQEVQLTRTSQALAAPSLTTMVAAAVWALELEYGGNLMSTLPPPHSVSTVEERLTVHHQTLEETSAHVLASNVVVKGKDQLIKDDDDEDEDDDVPLMALCKRKSEHCVEDSPHKKHRNGGDDQDPKNCRIHPWYLAKLVQYISTRWGHVYQEPSHEDYVW
jgi:hypothetical protein